jgi:hypothetical protein
MLTRILLFMLIALSVSFTAIAQRKHEISIGAGIGSSEQFRNVSSDYTHDKTRMGMPFVMPGVLFISYKYHYKKILSIGATAGFDNTEGRVTRRRILDDYFYGFPEGTLGIYQRRSRTIATEVVVNYHSDEDGTFYFSLGGGYTFSRVTIDYDNNVYDEVTKKWPKALGPDPLSINDNRFAHQVTLFGYRTAGRLGFFTELGFGYKGLVHLGAGYAF